MSEPPLYSKLEEKEVSIRVAQPEESVRRRYASTLSAQFIQLIGSLITAGIIPNALGPKSYGNYNFLLNTMSVIRNFLMPSMQAAFFTFSSQEKKSGSLSKIFLVILLIQIIIVFLLVGCMAIVDKIDWLWPGQVVDQIVIITVLEWFVFLGMILRQLGNSKGLVTYAQVLSIGVVLINTTGILILNFFNLLTFYSYAWLNTFSAILIVILLGYWLLVVNADLCWEGSVKERLKDYFQRWWTYASPLIFLEYYTPVLAYLSIYFLQRWYGSEELGYFSLAFRWSAFVLVFTTSAVPIFWREIANAIAKQMPDRAANTYIKFNHLLFFLTFVLCCWLSFNSRILVDLMVGDKFVLAIPILSIMAFYPLQQTYGQIETAVFKSTEQTLLYRNLGILYSLIDVIAGYLLLASPSAPVPGLGLGGLGMALRMVVVGLLGVFVYEFASHRFFRKNYFYTLLNKTFVIMTVLICGWLALFVLGNYLAGVGVVDVFTLIFSSIVYFMLISLIFIMKPDLAGISRNEMNENIKKIRNLLHLTRYTE